MKKLMTLLSFTCVISTSHTLIAQDVSNEAEIVATDYINRSPIYDYSEYQLNNTDSIPDFETATDKLKISGIIYEADGVTPAKDVVLFIYQPDEYGNYEMKTHNQKRYVINRGWIKTDANGQYTFYTFVPGKHHRSTEFKHILSMIKEPGKQEYEIDSFLFDDDPLLTKSCRKKLAKKGVNSILKLEKKENNMYVATRDIVLKTASPELK
jgi:protocatechuate 3,4-dioxygenase beta subunit